MTATINLGRFGMVTLLLFGACLVQAGSVKPVKVTVEDEKPVFVEAAMPIDPTPRVMYTPSGLIAQIRDQNNRNLHLSHFPVINIDGRITQMIQPNMGVGRVEKMNQLLPPSAGGKKRQGFQTVVVIDDLRITLTAELAAARPSELAKTREMGTVLLRYTVENIGKQARKFGLKGYIDMYVISNDGAMFAAPTMPNKILDGIELKGKTLPPYVQCLERPDLKNPGYVSHISIDLGSSIEKASRVVLSQHGAGFNGWDMPAQPSGGDSAVGIFFDPIEIKPGGRREFGYAYGKGIAIAPESEGRVDVQLAGSFALGKRFTVTALVNDPVIGQSLMLELPKGLTLLEGREIQPVPQATLDPPQSLVEWQCRVDELGRHPLRLRSSTGMTQTKILTIRAGE